MEKAEKRRGRPRKEKDRIEPWQFFRAAIAMSAYDDARKAGNKHGVAVREAVEAVRERGWRMSDSEVRRVLSRWRPRESQTILLFERKRMSEKEVALHRRCLDQLGMLHEKKVNLESDRPREAFTIRFDERPNYPCSNRKKP